VHRAVLDGEREHLGSSYLRSPAGIALAPVVGSIVDFTGDDYRYTFASACVLALIALWSAWHVHRQFMKLGGPKNYVAP
jgi:hypothetical protein